MGDSRIGLRASAALAVGTLVLHQLRYALGFGDAAGETLAAHGHGYLMLVTPLAALFAALAAGHFLAALARAGRSRRPYPAPPRLGRLWLAASAALLVTYAGLELLEGLLSAGHPSGFAGLLGGGGAWVVPLALAIGLLVALLLRGAHAALAHAAQGAGRGRSVRRPPSAGRWPAVDLFPSCPLGRNLAGRAPPLASS